MVGSMNTSNSKSEGINLKRVIARRTEIENEIGDIRQCAIDRMFEKVPLDEIVRDYLGDEKAARLAGLYDELEKLDGAEKGG